MSDIVKLKDMTGAGMMDCKKALEEAKGNLDKAADILREKGKAQAAKKQDRIAAEGACFSYVHLGGKIAVVVEINCETDFAAKSEKFQELGKDVAMHIAAFSPQYVSETEVPTEQLEHEKEVLRNKARNDKKPEAVIEKMLEGQVKKFYSEICLLHQPFLRDQAKTVKDIVTETTAAIGEKVAIRRFVRYQMGEGLEKRNENFAAEVAKVTGK